MIGQTISHYRVVARPGAGGMGVVYKAEDTALQRTVALKFLPPWLTRDAEARQRFLHEARAAAAQDHPSICNVHEINETADGQVYIAMSDGVRLDCVCMATPAQLQYFCDRTWLNFQDSGRAIRGSRFSSRWQGLKSAGKPLRNGRRV